MENFIDTTDAIYITLEYMPGGTLKQLIEKTKRLKESESKIILYQVARAVQYLHNRSIAHRDLKVGNFYKFFFFDYYMQFKTRAYYIKTLFFSISAREHFTFH